MSGAISPAACPQTATRSAKLVGNASEVELVPDRCNFWRCCHALPSVVLLHAAHCVAWLAFCPMQLCKRAWVLPCAIDTVLWSPVI